MADGTAVAAAIRGELRKLANLSSLVLLVVFIVILWQDAGRMTHFAWGQAPIAVAAEHDGRAAVDAACAPAARAVDPTPCEVAAGDLAANRELAPNAVALGRIAESLGTLPGLVTFVAHQAASGLGWLFVALLAALHLGRERGSGSLATSLTCLTRPRYLLAKSASLLVACLVALAVSVAALLALRPTFFRPVRVPETAGLAAVDPAMVRLDPDAAWTSWSHSLVAVAAAVAVLVAVVALFTALAALAPDPIVAGAALGGTVVGLHLLERWSHLGRWLPARAVSAFVGMSTGPFGLTDVRLWETSGRPATIYLAPHAPTVAVLSVVGWTVVWIGATVAAWHHFTRCWPG